MNLNYILNNDANRFFWNDLTHGAFGTKSPVTHYDANGEMLSLDAYNKSLEDFSALVKAEHKSLTSSNKQTLVGTSLYHLGNTFDALFHLELANFGIEAVKTALHTTSLLLVTAFKGLSFVYNPDALQAFISLLDARNYNNDGIKFYSLIPHFKNNEGEIKDSAQFHKEWEAMKLSLQEYHEEMVEYEYSSNLKAALVYSGKIFTDLSNFNFVKALGDAGIAVGCAARGVVENAFGAIYGVFNVNSAFQAAVTNKSNAISNSIKSSVDFVASGAKAGVYAAGGVAYDASAWAIEGITPYAKASANAVGNKASEFGSWSYDTVAPFAHSAVNTAYDASAWAAEGIASGAKASANAVGNKASEFGSWAYDTVSPFAESTMNGAYAAGDKVFQNVHYAADKASEFGSWSYNELTLLGHNSFSLIPALALFSLEEAVLI
jgi:hypothetical protein